MPSVVIRRKNGLKILKENDKKRIKKVKMGHKQLLHGIYAINILKMYLDFD